MSASTPENSPDLLRKPPSSLTPLILHPLTLAGLRPFVQTPNPKPQRSLLNQELTNPRPQKALNHTATYAQTCEPQAEAPHQAWYSSVHFCTTGPRNPKTPPAPASLAEGASFWGFGPKDQVRADRAPEDMGACKLQRCAFTLGLWWLHGVPGLRLFTLRLYNLSFLVAHLECVLVGSVNGGTGMVCGA